MLNVILGLANLRLNLYYRLNREIGSVGYDNKLLITYLVERHLRQLILIKGCALKLELKGIRLVRVG